MLACLLACFAISNHATHILFCNRISIWTAVWSTISYHLSNPHLSATMASITECLSVLFWCLPCVDLPEEDLYRDPLLPQYQDDTTLQRELHQKLHTYQMLRALTQGFMPSNEQAIVNLRTILAADILNPDNEELSDSGRALVHYVKLWLKQFMDLLQHKNSNDQIQDFIWYLSKSRVSVDMEDIVHRASKAKSKAQTAAGEY